MKSYDEMKHPRDKRGRWITRQEQSAYSKRREQEAASAARARRRADRRHARASLLESLRDTVNELRHRLTGEPQMMLDHSRVAAQEVRRVIDTARYEALLQEVLPTRPRFGVQLEQHGVLSQHAWLELRAEINRRCQLEAGGMIGDEPQPRSLAELLGIVEMLESRLMAAALDERYSYRVTPRGIASLLGEDDALAEAERALLQAIADAADGVGPLSEVAQAALAQPPVPLDEVIRRLDGEDEPPR